ncbi:hypothetical protein [Ramlibacter sp.]|uniref:hypothetical protein n=1 Tax=Ramlibacter sp. TaxID=1917967 RepID=UPI002D7EADCF|nr:hypothetical protein [Ramlibacter sp.]
MKVALTSFYSRGDERRLFSGFEEIPAIRSVHGVGRELLLEIDLSLLGKEALRELVALLWRYGIPLAPLRVLSSKKKFSWLNDHQGYWYGTMFDEAATRPLHEKVAGKSRATAHARSR